MNRWAAIIALLTIGPLLIAATGQTTQERSTPKAPDKESAKPAITERAKATTKSATETRNAKVFDIRAVDANELVELLRSAAKLWKMDAKISLSGKEKSIRIETKDAHSLGELYKLLAVLDRKIDATPRRGVVSSSPQKRVDLRPRAGSKTGRRVDIAAGDIPVREFLAFLADHTGAPLIVEGGAPGKGIDEKLVVAATIHDADDAIVEALLEANGWILEDSEIKGRRVLRVYHSTNPPSPIPRERKIIRVKRD